MKMKCIVLFARPYSFTDEKSGKSQTGISLSYVFTDKLTPYQDETGYYGYQPLKDNLSYELAKNINEVPGIYEAEMTMKSVDGRPVMKIVGLKFEKPLQ